LSFWSEAIESRDKSTGSYHSFIFLFGLSVGSFLNVVICRLKTKEPILFSRSHCPKCGTVLKWSDLIPVLSFLLQRGKCQYCGQKISWQYPVVELSTGLLFLFYVILRSPLATEGSHALATGFFASLRMTTAIELFYFLLIICFLIVIFVYDLKHYLIPNKVVYPAIVIALAYRFFEKSFVNPLAAALLAAGFFLSLVLVSKGQWMGLGDVKLVGLMGLVLGWPNILFALFLSFIFGALVGLALVLSGKKTIKSQIPFGPFLAGATILIIVYGQYLTNWFQVLFSF
jgi:prepilin signal peptidase PulO-like enzyme (type II secretory pathway)